MKNNCQETYFKNTLTFFLVIAVFFSCVRALDYGGRIPGIDFYQFWVVGKAVNQFDLSARAYFRTIKLARTIADLDLCDEIQVCHISEALQYRIKT